MTRLRPFIASMTALCCEASASWIKNGAAAYGAAGLADVGRAPPARTTTKDSNSDDSFQGFDFKDSISRTPLPRIRILEVLIAAAQGDCFATNGASGATDWA